MKSYADKKRHACDHSLQVGDTVLIRQQNKNKLTSHYDSRPYSVTQIKGSMITAERSDHNTTRHVTFFKKISSFIPTTSKEKDDEDEDNDTPTSIIQPPRQVQQPPQQPPALHNIHSLNATICEAIDGNRCHQYESVLTNKNGLQKTDYKN